MKGKKFVAAVLACTLAAGCAAAFTACTDKKDDGGGTHTAVAMDASKAKIVVTGYEWGPAVSKLIVEFKGDVTGVKKETFAVTMGSGFGKATRTVSDAYSCDEKGNKVTTASKYVAIEMTTKYGEASPFNYDQTAQRNVWNDAISVTVKVNNGQKIKVGATEYLDGDKFDYTVTANDRLVPQTATWQKDKVEYKENGKDITLSRASWAPEGATTDSGKNPLVIWLHGGGEGGTDIDIALLGNEVTALTADNSTNVQGYFKKDGLSGAYVLAVQSPTMWMDSKGDGDYGNSSANGTPTGEPQTSYYTEALWKAITTYVEGNSDIDTDRIYIGGCSNGGYMTMNLALEHGDYFAAYYPICQGYMSGNISDEMLAKLKDLNMWFLLSEKDNTLKPDKYTLPLYYRLLQKGAENIHLTYKPNVTGVDDPNPSSGWGTPGFYDGHWSWIYAFNDDVKTEIDNSKVTSQNDLTAANCTKAGNMWEWIAAQKKSGTENPPAQTTDYTFEAESATLSGSVSIPNAWGGTDVTVSLDKKTAYTGNETKGPEVTGIGYFYGENAAITWEVTAEEACEATLVLWAASSVTKTEQQMVTMPWGTFPQNVVVGVQPVEFTAGSQPVTLVVNGTQITLNGTVTGIESISETAKQDYTYYANYVGTVTAKIQLKAGTNTIVIKAPAAEAKLNIDKVVIKSPVVLSYTPVNNEPQDNGNQN